MSREYRERSGKQLGRAANSRSPDASGHEYPSALYLGASHCPSVQDAYRVGVMKKLFKLLFFMDAAGKVLKP